MHTTADLHAWEDAYDHDEAAEAEAQRQWAEMEAERLVSSPYKLAKWLESYDATCTDFNLTKTIRIAGDWHYLTDALILAACHPDPAVQGVILADCREEIVNQIARTL